MSAAWGYCAGVPGQVDEELVGAQPVRQVGPRGQVRAAPAGLVAAGEILLALPGHDLVSELAEQVVVRVRAALPPLRPEPVHHAQSGQAQQPPVGEVHRREQCGGDLVGGEQVVVVQPAEQDEVAIGEAGLRPQQRVINTAHTAPWGRPQTGSVGARLQHPTRGLTCGVGCGTSRYRGPDEDRPRLGQRHRHLSGRLLRGPASPARTFGAGVTGWPGHRHRVWCKAVTGFCSPTRLERSHASEVSSASGGGGVQPCWTVHQGQTSTRSRRRSSADRADGGCI